jgi:hypothetical protein
MLIFHRLAWLAVLAGLAWPGPGPAAFAQAGAGGLDDAVLAEMNYARAHPAQYARALRLDPQGYPGDDRAAFEEAMDFLEQQPPLPPLDTDKRVAAAARDHVRSQGSSGAVGHGAPGGLGQRLHDHGVWAGLSAENIAYGSRTGADVVRQLIIDSGVPNRGHRANIFSRSYQLAGVSCGPHPAYAVVCVIDFAGALPSR